VKNKIDIEDEKAIKPVKIMITREIAAKEPNVKDKNIQTADVVTLSMTEYKKMLYELHSTQDLAKELEQDLK
jgi:hypothetical protein